MAWCLWSSKSSFLILKTTDFLLPNLGPAKVTFWHPPSHPRNLQNGLVRLELKICFFDTENDRFSTARFETCKSHVLAASESAPRRFQGGLVRLEPFAPCTSFVGCKVGCRQPNVMGSWAGGSKRTTWLDTSVGRTAVRRERSEHLNYYI